MIKQDYKHLITDLDKCFSPIIGLKSLGGTPTVSLSGKVLSLSDGSSSINIDMATKSSEMVCSEINRSGLLFKATNMSNIKNLSDFNILYQGDLSIDGSYLIKVVAHTFVNKNLTKIRLLDFYRSDRNSPWHPIISNGQVVYTWRNKRYVFSIPEINNQIWSKRYGKGYVDVVDEIPEIVDSKGVLKTYRQNILYRNKNITLRINGVDYGSKYIKDVDSANGIVYLSKSIDTNDNIAIDYTYKEDNYIVDAVDINPTEFHNPGILGKYLTIYLVPSLDAAGVSRTSCVKYVLSNTLYGGIQSISYRDEPVLLIGCIQIKYNDKTDEISIVDTRSYGGGIAEDQWKDAVKENSRAYSVADFGAYDGKPFPGNMSLLIKIPTDTKDRLEENEIEDNIRRFMALGTYVFLEYT